MTAFFAFSVLFFALFVLLYIMWQRCIDLQEKIQLNYWMIYYSSYILLLCSMFSRITINTRPRVIPANKTKYSMILFLHVFIYWRNGCYSKVISDNMKSYFPRDILVFTVDICKFCFVFFYIVFI